MNKLLLCLFFAFAGTSAFSQKIYFVYLQSESEQPFFVKMNNKVHSSTGSGYLILPRLKDSSYNINVGFPEAKWPEQSFTIAINKKDRGYLLKNFGEKGWGLFDLQNLSVQMSTTGKASIDNKPSSVPGEVSAFTDILARATDDPSLKDKPVRPKPEVKKEVAVVEQPAKKEETITAIKDPVVLKAEPVETAVVKKEEPIVVKTEPVETPIIKKEETNIPKTEPVVTATVKKEEPATTKPAESVEAIVTKKEEPKTDPVVTEPAIIKKEEAIVENKVEPVKKDTEETFTKSEVTKGSSSDGAEGHDIVFIDKYENGKNDTIRVLIPNPKPLVQPVVEQAKEEKKFLEINSESAKKEEPVKTETTTPVVVMETPKQKDEIKTAVAETPAKTPVVNNCAATAEENDFLKLRKKMAAAKEDDDMVSEARKYFKTTCFTVYQIRNLGSLFLNDEGKYKFFDAAYSHASDAHNFISLQLELKDEYYVKRFKAMLK